MLIKFIDITIEGFGSISKRLTYKLNTKGLIIISGENGAGKTTIFSALTWCCFGQTLKARNEVQTWEDKRPAGYKGVRVTTRFKIGGDKYKIIRHQNYKGKTKGAKGKDRLVLIVNGKENKNSRTKPEIQKEILDILGYSFDLFRNSVVFGQKMKRLIEESGPNRNKVLEQAFEILFIKKAKDKASKKKKKLIDTLLKVQPKFNRLSERLENNREKLKEFKVEKEKFEENKVVRMEKKDKTLYKLKEELTEVRGFIVLNRSIPNELRATHEKQERLEKQKEECDNLNNILFKLELSIENKTGDAMNIFKRVEEYKKGFISVKKTCSKCKNKLTKKQIKLERKTYKLLHKNKRVLYEGCIEALSELKKQETELNSSIASVKGSKDKLDILKHDIERLDKQKNKLDVAFQSKKNINERIEEKKVEIKAIKEEEFSLDIVTLRGKIDTIKKKLKPIRRQYKSINKDIELLGWAIKDPLSNSGIKAYLFNDMLKEVNRACTKYNKILGWKVEIVVNLESARKEFITRVFQDDIERLYDDLSGGQQQLVNICIAFAIQDVVGVERGCNVALMDEVFESLSKKSIGLVTEIIREKSQTKAIHLITHLQEFNQTNSKIILLELDDSGNTQLTS